MSVAAAAWRARARAVIPGGSFLLSKRPERHLPAGWPSYYRLAHGAELVDADGRTWLDMGSMGTTACVLGYSDFHVREAVRAANENGVVSSLLSPVEVELMERLVSMHPWAQRAWLTRTGGEALVVAVRAARAATGRDMVLVAGYHGWHDWYLAANLGADNALDGLLLPGLPPAGVPRGLAGTTETFAVTTGGVDRLATLLGRHRERVAAVVLEPARSSLPESALLLRVRELASRAGAVLVFDEVTTGWRYRAGGVHPFLGVDPDVVVYAKAIANGYACAAIVGRAEALDVLASGTFCSSTAWTERLGPTAALATITKLARSDYRHLAAIGGGVRRAWIETGWDARGTDYMPAVAWTDDPEENAARQTYATQRLLDFGILGDAQFRPSFAHKQEHVDRYAEACRVIGREMAAWSHADVLAHLHGPVVERGFARLVA